MEFPCWQAVNAQRLKAYDQWLERKKYEFRTRYFELNTLKQVFKWLVDPEQGYLPAEKKISLRLDKPSEESSTYCYTNEQVQAMIEHCFGQPDLRWLGNVIVALSHTGVRIGELVQLRWPHVDLENKMIHIVDNTRSNQKHRSGGSASTKNHKSRWIPIHDQLQLVLESLPRHRDGFVFHGPRGGRLKPDTLRQILYHEVLTPLAERFPKTGPLGFIDGRLHSFRHYFCSQAIRSGLPALLVQKYMAHKSDAMTRLYCHLEQVTEDHHRDKIGFPQCRIDSLDLPAEHK